MYSIKIFNSIRDVPIDQWDAFAKGQSCSYSREFWNALEKSDINDYCYKHALIFDNNDSPVALTSFYTLTTDIAIFSSGWLKNVIGFVRQVFPRFLKFKMLECGTPITMNKPFLAKQGSNEDEIVRFLARTFSAIAKKEKTFVIVIRDIEPHNSNLIPSLSSSSFHIIDILPNTSLDIIWGSPEAYNSSLKSHYRRKIMLQNKSNENQGIHCELREDFTELADTLCNQWMVVHNNAKEFQREKLTPEFYREMSIQLGARTKALLFYRNEELIGHVLLLMDNETLRWMYVGRNKSIKDDLYFYICNKIVETAIILKAKRLELGLTTYDPKLNVGAKMIPVKAAIKTTNFLNVFAGLVYQYLNYTPEIRHRNVFKHNVMVQLS